MLLLSFYDDQVTVGGTLTVGPGLVPRLPLRHKLVAFVVQARLPAILTETLFNKKD